METQLTLNDIAAAVQLIDVVTARGAIRGEELTQVGALRDRYVSFLRAASPQPEATTQEEAKGSEESVDTEE